MPTDVFHYLPIFLIGVFVFQYRSRIIGERQMLGFIAVMLLGMLRLHLPIGVSTIGLLSHYLPYSSSHIGVLDAIEVAASMGAAWVMYQFIEKSSQELSSAIKFAHRARCPAAEPVVVPAPD